MATKKEKGSGVLAHSWVPEKLADDLKRASQLEDRSVSGFIRLAIKDKLGDSGETK